MNSQEEVKQSEEMEEIPITTTKTDLDSHDSVMTQEQQFAGMDPAFPV